MVLTVGQGYYVPPLKGVHTVFGADSVGISMRLSCV